MTKNNNLVKTLLASVLIAGAFTSVPALAAETNPGTISIPIERYEEMQKALEAKSKDQYWNMSFEQILDKENGNREKAWEKYDYYVLRNLYLDQTVSDSNVSGLINDINVLNELSPEKPINIVISSPGGSVFAGMKLYNAMMNSAAPVNTVCNGMTASMAAVILSAGDRRTAMPNCSFLIHEMSGGSVSGQTTEHIKTADWYMSIENQLTKILSENSGINPSDIRKLWEYESFFNAEETLELGFVDTISGSKPRQLSGDRAVPEHLMPKNHVIRNLTTRLKE